MAIAIRAKQGLTRRHLLARSASSIVLAGMGGLAAPTLSRAADRPKIAGGIASGDVSTDSAVDFLNDLARLSAAACLFPLPWYSGGGRIWP